MASKLNPENEREEINSELLKLWNEANDIGIKLSTIANIMAADKESGESFQKKRLQLEKQLSKITEKIKVLRERYNKLPK